MQRTDCESRRRCLYVEASDDSCQVVTEPSGAGAAADQGAAARGRAVGRFAANARRPREGEITPAEFDEIMREGRDG